VSKAPVRAEDYDEHGRAYAEAMIQLNRETDEGVSWSGNERNVAFLNLGCKPRVGSPSDFANVSAVSGFDFPDDARALASIDWDFDGDMDLLVTNRTGPRLRVLQNNSNASGRSVLLRLQGTRCNREGIGARVEVELQAPDGDKMTLIRTRYAGHGFLSQSSKWLHVGLGEEASITQVTVRWPGGQRQQFSGVEPGGHFLLTQGEGAARRWNPPRMTKTLSHAPNEAPPLNNAVAVRLERPIPLPPLTCTDRDGKPIDLVPPTKGPVLLNLWATWCRPCRAELAELANRAGELRSAGLDVVAVNVEGLDGQRSDIASKAQAVLDEIGFPFRSTMADQKLMDCLHLAHKVLFVRPTKLPIPSSLLVDTHGRIAAIYRGPVSVDRLASDVRALVDSRPETWQNHNRPFAGRWFGRQDPIYYVTVAKELIERNNLADAERFLLEHAATLQEEKKYPGMLMLCGTRLLQAGQPKQGSVLLEKSVQLAPNVAASRNNLAIALLKQQRLSEARVHLERAIAIKPDYADAQMNLARVAIGQARYGDALAPLEVVLKLAPSEEALLHKGIVLIRLGRWQEAKVAHQALLRHRPDHVQALVNLGGIHATLGELDNAIGYYERAIQLDPSRKSLRATITALQGQRKN
jgi:Flp pilus assembly protein TadD/peroxiredoxin